MNTPAAPRRVTRRLTLTTLTGVLTTATLAACSMSSTPERPTTATSTTARVAANSTDDDLSADDTSLDARARALIRIGQDGIARENQAAAEAFFAPDFRFHGPDGEATTREELFVYFAACRRAFDDFQVTRQAIFSDGGAFVGARSTFSGVFTRRFDASPIGPLEPTGNRMMYRVNNVFRYNNEGRLAEEWAQYDSRLLLESLGVRLVPAGPKPS